MKIATQNIVSPEALPGVRQQSNATADDFGGAQAAALMRSGARLQNSGEELSRVAGVMQERENADLLFRAEAVLKEKQLEFDRSVDERRGQNAWGVTKEAETFWQKQIEEQGKNFTNDRQRQLFEQTVMRLRVGHIDRISQYESGQRRESVVESANASIVGSINVAAENATQWQARPDVSDLKTDPAEFDSKRLDGTSKGRGFLGPLKVPGTDEFATERSIGVSFGGKETQIPLIVPTLTRKELDTVLANKDPKELPQSIIDKAAEHAKSRMQKGLDPFYTDGEPTRDPIEVAKQDIVKRTMVLSRLNGWAPEREQLELNKNLTNMHKQVLQALVTSDPKKAKAYYALNKEEINGTERDSVERVLKEGVLRVTAQEVGDKVMADGMDETAALAYVRQNYEGDDEAAAITEVKTRFAEQKSQKTLLQKENSDKAWGVIAQGGSRRQIPPEVWANLEPKEQIQINDHLRIRADRAKAEAEGKAIKTDMAAYYDLRKMAVNDPEGFASMNLLTSPEFNKLSRSDQEQMIGFQVSAAKGDDKFKEARTIDSQITATTASLGIKDKTSLAIAEGKIRQAIDEAGRQQGKPLGADERQKIIDKMFIEGEIGTGFFAPDRRVYEVYGTEDAKSFVPKIPTAERNKIIEALKRNGEKPTDAAIATLYKKKLGL